MSILENAKEVAKAVEEIHNLELYQRVLSLHSDIVELVEENNRLRDKVKELTDAISLRKAMAFRGPFYYREGDETPHCPACYEANGKAVHVVFEFESPDSTRWDCPSCKHIYMVEKNGGSKARAPRSGPAGGL
jgi:hypothetical protein